MANFREYLICDNDTVESIALQQTGDARNWRKIVLLNNLDFPFIVPERETEILAARQLYAAGQQVFAVNESASATVTIPKGTVLELTRVGLRNIGDQAPRYYTTGTATIAVGSMQTSIEIVCDTPGDWGNTLANSIKSVVQDGSGNMLLNDGSWVPKPDFDSTYNATDLVSGKARNIKTTGDTILIPDHTVSTPLVKNKTYAEVFGGSDLFMNDGDLTADPRTGDLALAIGYQNIAQSLLARLSTRRGELTRYPWYGSNLSVYIGRSGDYVLDLIKTDIIATCMQDDRVADVTINQLRVERDVVILDDVDIALVGQLKPIQLRGTPIPTA